MSRNMHNHLDASHRDINATRHEENYDRKTDFHTE